MSDFCDKCERVDDLCAEDAPCNKLKAEVERLTQENKRMFLRDFKEHPMVVGLERQHECDKALYVEQFERAEKAEAEIKRLQEEKEYAERCRLAKVRRETGMG